MTETHFNEIKHVFDEKKRELAESNKEIEREENKLDNLKFAIDDL